MGVFVAGRQGLPPAARLIRFFYVHTQGFRDQAFKAMQIVKKDEYETAKREVVKAQQRIDQARIEQIEKISESQSRTLTALEKARLMQLQTMQKNDVKAAEKCVFCSCVCMFCGSTRRRG
jgi:hypothetical protein